MNKPTQIKNKANIAFFNLLPESFISPIEAKIDIPHHSGTDFHKGLEYKLVLSRSKRYAEHIGGDGAIEYQYLGTFVNKKVEDEWTLIKPLEHHTKDDIGHTGGVNMILRDESMLCNVDYNYKAIIRVVDILKEINVIKGTLTNNFIYELNKK